MGGITEPEFILELQGIVKKNFLSKKSHLGNSYELLHNFTENEIIPIIHKKSITLSIVELTTCGLLSDLLTGKSGASHFFLMGIIPYNSNVKQQIKIPPEFLQFGGPGTVSSETARMLAMNVRNISGSILGVAETGLLASNELAKKKTKKKPGKVFLSIVSENSSLEKQLKIQSDLPRKLMRHEIAFRVLQSLKTFLDNN
ncbi:MAG: CinA family protein [Candidatus Hermodarchaeota archaeon]